MHETKNHGTGRDSWKTLVAAHHATQLSLANRHAGVPRHEPRAAVLACSDARVPPSVLFDQPAGNLFVVRLAGNTASPEALASLDYAVDVLGVDLIVILGHTNCGAVQAAAGGTCSGHLAPIVRPICELARVRPDADVDELVAINVAVTMATLADHPGPAGAAVRQGRLDLQGAVHDLATGDLVPVPMARVG